MKQHVRITCIIAMIVLTAAGCSGTNGKTAAASTSSTIGHGISETPTLDAIRARGTVRIGTTGDYRPLTFREQDGSLWGLEIDVAHKIASSLGVEVQFVPTSWPTLSEDTCAEPKKFDFAIGGITINDKRKETMDMSDGYLKNGKTILCRSSDSKRFKSLADIDKEDVVVMVNPGGLNEKFARDNLKKARIIVYPKNEEIPDQIASKNADIMISEITEVPWYVQNDSRLSAPLASEPFTHGQIGVLMAKGQDDLLAFINEQIAQMKKDGSLNRLLKKYGF